MCAAAEEKAGTPTTTPASSVKDLDVAIKIEEGTDDITVRQNSVLMIAHHCFK